MQKKAPQSETVGPSYPKLPPGHLQKPVFDSGSRSQKYPQKGFEPGYPKFQHLIGQHCNQSTTHFRSAIIIFRLIRPARCKKCFSLQGFPHVSDNTATKGTVCLGGQGHNPGDWEAVRRKIGPPNCPAELLGFLRRIGGVVGRARRLEKDDAYLQVCFQLHQARN